MSVPLFIVDAFTDRAFTGNPAAVCPLEAPAPEAWMQRLAIEMNLSETVYLWPEPESDADFRIRWFTPGREVNLCGHATLAASHALYETGRAPENRPIRFASRSGPLAATRRAEGRIALDFPARPAPAGEIPAVLAPQLEGAETFLDGGEKLVAVFPAERDVADFAPDLVAIERCASEGLVVTAPSDDGATHFVSRFFAPAVGIAEDPVCGSAHCVLAPYWAGRLGLDSMTARQLSPRGGIVHVELRGDRVTLAGRAVTTLRGELAPAARPEAIAEPA